MNPHPEHVTATRLAALQASATRLASIVAPLQTAQLGAPSDAGEWTIADVLSHLGSGAVILHRRLDDILAGRTTDDAFAPSTWDTWNAKEPADQAADALRADQALIDRINSLTAAEQDGFQFSMGPMTFDLAGYIALRLNEHGLHTWDIEVALHPTATVAREVTDVVIDNLEMIARYAAKPTGTQRTVHIRTTAPDRAFALTLDIDAVSLSPADPGTGTDLELPAEAFIRLVYGRLDPDHTPPGLDETQLDQLRAVFPGV